jgi:hypothetical protein
MPDAGAASGIAVSDRTLAPWSRIVNHGDPRPLTRDPRLAQGAERHDSPLVHRRSHRRHLKSYLEEHLTGANARSASEVANHRAPEDNRRGART